MQEQRDIELRQDVRKCVEGVSACQVSLATLTARAQCPSPGLCLTLQARAEAQEKELRELRDERARAQGGMRVVMLFWGALVATAGGLISWGLSHFAHKGP